MIQVDGMCFAGIDRNAVHGDLKILFFQTTRLKKYRRKYLSCWAILQNSGARYRDTLQLPSRNVKISSESKAVGWPVRQPN